MWKSSEKLSGVVHTNEANNAKKIMGREAYYILSMRIGRKRR
jgi:hypothetical protein